MFAAPAFIGRLIRKFIYFYILNRRDKYKMDLFDDIMYGFITIIIGIALAYFLL